MIAVRLVLARRDGPVSCIVCHHGQLRPGTTTVTFHRDGQTIVVNEVPADVGENCDEPYVAENQRLR